MKPIHTILIAVAALIGGGIGGYLLGGHATAPRAPAADYSSDLEQSATADTRAPTRSQPESSAPRGAAARDAAGDPLDAWLATLPRTAPEWGDGRIFGRVTLEDGTPLAGATVSAVASRPTAQRSPPQPERDLRELIESSARFHAFRDAATVKVQTADDGSYEIAGLGDYEFSVSAVADGYACQPAGGFDNGRVQPDAVVDFIATGVIELTLDIRLPDGSQPPFATVLLAGSGGGNQMTWWRANPAFQLRPQRFTLHVTAGDHNEYRSAPAEVTLQKGDPPRHLLVHLQLSPGLSCQVLLPTILRSRSNPYLEEDVVVRLLADPPPEQQAEIPERTIIRKVDRQGKAVFAGLSRGPYRVLATCGSVVLAWRDVTIGAGTSDVTLEVPELNAADFIVCRVLDPEGMPAVGVRLYVTIYGDRRGGERRTVLGQGDGTFWVHRVPPAVEAPGDDWYYHIGASRQGNAGTWLRYASGATHEVELRLPVPTFLTIAYEGAGSHPRAKDMRAELYRFVDGRSTGQVWSTRDFKRRESEGLDGDPYRYGPLQPGSYQLNLKVADPGQSHYDGDSVALWSLEVAEGENHRTLRLPTLHTLTLNVADPDNARYIVMNRRGDGLGGFRRVEGRSLAKRVVIRNITPGEWTLRTAEGETTVFIQGDTEITVQVWPYNCLQLAVPDDSPLKQSELRDGDLLMRVNNHPAESVEALIQQVRDSANSESATWTVVREGAILSLVIPGELFAKVQPGRAYVHWQPARHD